MVDNKLFVDLSRLGYPLLEPTEAPDVNQTIAEVVRSRDTRLWEGFPVLLAK